MSSQWFKLFKKQGKVARQAHFDLPKDSYEREMGKEGFLARSPIFITAINTPVGPILKGTIGRGLLIPMNWRKFKPVLGKHRFYCAIKAPRLE